LHRAVEQVREAYNWYEGITSGIVVALLDQLSAGAEENVADVAGGG
jgi:hypothetical protein